jgi:hypothetical protein
VENGTEFLLAAAKGRRQESKIESPSARSAPSARRRIFAMAVERPAELAEGIPKIRV